MASGRQSSKPVSNSKPRALNSVSTNAPRRSSMSKRSWCDICRDDIDGGDILCCAGCPALFHRECVLDLEEPEEGKDAEGWFCDACKEGHMEAEADAEERAAAEGRIKAVQQLHADLRRRMAWFFMEAEKARIRKAVIESYKPRLQEARVLSLTQ